MQHLFVYGTLRGSAAGIAELATLFNTSARLLGDARLNGRLYAVSHYPGAVPSDASDEWVHGELYQLLAPEALLARLDDYEECSPSFPEPHEYRRCVLPVQLIHPDRGQLQLSAWVYVYARDFEESSRIHSGRFTARASR
ncbi:MAG: gamma-glutamylcyclotransferase [Gammaproteobacteria bacterium]|nr:gamma-glutamylcyclotransferase [Gammaproteobacteria bacterium]